MESSIIITEISEALEKATLGNRDVEEMRRACEVMDEIRNDVMRRVGIIDIDLTERDE